MKTDKLWINLLGFENRPERADAQPYPSFEKQCPQPLLRGQLLLKSYIPWRGKTPFTFSQTEV